MNTKLGLPNLTDGHGAVIDSSLISSGFFAGASDDLKALMVELGAESHLEAGQDLIEQGAMGDTLYVVLSGELEISVLSGDGRRLALNVAHTGDVLGEIALFDPGPRTASVTARTACHMWGVKNADIMSAMKKSPALGADLIRLAGQRLRWMDRQLHEQVFLSLPARLARKILHLTARDKETQPKLALSQLELAEFAGASREAVSKTLSGWNSAGTISLGRGSIQLLDRDALGEIAELSLF